jgi:hypothetical protein
VEKARKRKNHGKKKERKKREKKERSGCEDGAP